MRKPRKISENGFRTFVYDLDLDVDILLKDTSNTDYLTQIKDKAIKNYILYREVNDGKIVKMLRVDNEKTTTYVTNLPIPKTENRYLVTFQNKEQETYTTSEFRERFGMGPCSVATDSEDEISMLDEFQIRSIERQKNESRVRHHVKPVRTEKGIYHYSTCTTNTYYASIRVEGKVRYFHYPYTPEGLRMAREKVEELVELNKSIRKSKNNK